MLGYHSSWLRDDNIKLICKIIGNMDTNWGKYDHDILSRLNWRISKIYVLHMQDILLLTPWKSGILSSNDTRFTMLIESSRLHGQMYQFIISSLPEVDCTQLEAVFWTIYNCTLIKSAKSETYSRHLLRDNQQPTEGTRRTTIGLLLVSVGSWAKYIGMSPAADGSCRAPIRICWGDICFCGRFKLDTSWLI